MTRTGSRGARCTRLPVRRIVIRMVSDTLADPRPGGVDAASLESKHARRAPGFLKDAGPWASPNIEESGMLSDPNTAQNTPSASADLDDDYRRYYSTRRRYASEGLSQIITTSVLVIVAFAAGWFGNFYVNRANYVPP